MFLLTNPMLKTVPNIQPMQKNRLTNKEEINIIHQADKDNAVTGYHCRNPT
jgi:hypothetical protein